MRYLCITATFLLLQLCAVVGLYPYGVERMLYAIAGLNMMWIFVWWSGVRKLLRLPLKYVVLDVFPFFGIALITTLSAHLLGAFVEHMILRLLVKLLIAGTHYWMWMHLLKPAVYQDCMNFLRRRKK